MGTDIYIKDRIKRFKNCLCDEDIKELINLIYEDGFSDGLEFGGVE